MYLEETQMRGRLTIHRNKKVLWSLAIAGAILASVPALAKNKTNTGGVATQMVVAVVRHSQGAAPVLSIQSSDLKVKEAGKQAQVMDWQPLSAGAEGMQLVILIDDSLQKTAATNFNQLQDFIRALPPTTQVTVGYMKFGLAAMAGAFTTDHVHAAQEVRIPEGIVGQNDSPYFCLSDLVTHWSVLGKPAAGRAVLMVTNGIDRRFLHGEYDPEDPYVAASIRDAQSNHVMVSAIYFRDAMPPMAQQAADSSLVSGSMMPGTRHHDFGSGDQGAEGSFTGENYMRDVSSSTGGNLYFEGMGNPVSFYPFLQDFNQYLASQYLLTFQANGAGLQKIKISTNVPSFRLEFPEKVMVGQQIAGASK